MAIVTTQVDRLKTEVQFDIYFHLSLTDPLIKSEGMLDRVIQYPFALSGSPGDPPIKSEEKDDFMVKLKVFYLRASA